MNPVSTSAITTLVVGMLTAGMGVLVTKGLLTTDQATALAQDAAALLMGVVAVGFGYWKSQQHTGPALVAAVNSGAVPGVFVAADSAVNANVPQVAITKTGAVVPDLKM